MFASVLYADPVKADELSITARQLHNDIFKDPGNVVPWSEGWGEEEQFYPRYFQPAGSLHLFLKNTGTKVITVNDVVFNGKSISEVCTRADFPGPVIWYRTNPEKIEPGSSAMVIVRLRKPLADTVSLGVTYDGGKVVKTNLSPSDSPRLRIASVSFDLKDNTIFLYIGKISTGDESVGRILLDGQEIPKTEYTLVNGDFKNDSPAYLELTADKPLKYGDYRVLTVETAAGNACTYQLRIRDDRFILGLIYGAQSRYALYQSCLFNTIYNLGGPLTQVPEDFWNGMEEHPKLSLIQTASRDEDVLRVIKTAPKERFIFNMIDEPDANDWWYTKLPLQERCGTSIMAFIEPMLRRVRNHAPYYLTTEVLDSTFAPANFYIYGEVTDIVSKDIYTLYTSGESGAIADVAPSVNTVLHASSPRPVNVVLWGIMATVNNFRRAYVPFENDAEVHYAIGSGTKGITYFMDTGGAVQSSGGEYYLGATWIKPLWQHMGKLNAKLTRLAPLLNKGYPSNVASSSNPEQLWVSALQSGMDSIVIVAVDRNYVVRANDSMKFPHVFPVKDESINVNLPDWLLEKDLKIVEVSWDKVQPINVNDVDGSIRIPVKELTYSRVYVVSKDPNIENRLALDENKLAEMQAVWPKPALRDGARLDVPESSATPVVFTADDVAKGEVLVDFTNPADLQKAISVRLVAAELDQLPNGLALFPLDKNLESRFELLYAFESPVPLKNITVSLLGTTPNFAYGSNNSVGIASSELASNAAGYEFIYDKSYKVNWDGGAKGAKLEKTLGKATTKFYVKVSMADPQIMWPGEYSNTISNLRVSWDAE
jgi:hypothetical protein